MKFLKTICLIHQSTLIPITSKNYGRTFQNHKNMKHFLGIVTMISFWIILYQHC